MSTKQNTIVMMTACLTNSLRGVDECVCVCPLPPPAAAAAVAAADGGASAVPTAAASCDCASSVISRCDSKQNC